MTILVIVAGGKGTRLKEVIGDLPKALAPIDGEENLSRLLNLGVEYGYKRAIVLAGFGGDKIEDYLATKWDHTALQVDVVHESEAAGTAGCFHELKGKVSERMIVLYGDILCDFDLKRFEYFHIKSKKPATVFVQPNSHMFDSDLVGLADDGSIQKIYQKPHDPNLMLENLTNAAAYVVEPEVLDYLPKGFSDWFQDIFPKMLEAEDYPIAYKSWEYLQDFGTPDRLVKASHDTVMGIVGQRRADSICTGGLIVNMDGSKNISQVMEKVRHANDLRIPVIWLGELSRELNSKFTETGVYIDVIACSKAELEQACLDAGINYEKSSYQLV